MRKQVSFALALSMVMTSGMATVANAAADDGKTNVVFWNSWTGGDGDTLEALVNKFNEESDTVHVEMTRTTSFGDMLQTSLPTGEAADLVLQSTNEITRYKSYLRSMDDIWENTGLKEEDFSPAYLSMCYNDDTLYAIPFQISAYMMYYNKDLFVELKKFQQHLISGQRQQRRSVHFLPPTTRFIALVYSIATMWSESVCNTAFWNRLHDYWK